MKRQLLTIGAAGAIGIAVAACTPPRPPAPPFAVPPCTQTVTRIYETNPVPCIPGEGQRLDVVMAISNQLDPVEQEAAGRRCIAWQGVIYMQYVDGLNRAVCRQTDPYFYGVWPPNVATGTSVAAG